VADLADCANEAGVTLTALSLAWALQRPGITTIVVGPRTLYQLTDQLAALDVVIDDELSKHIDEYRAAWRRDGPVLPRRQLRRLPPAALPLVVPGP
jgi:aryl-alcohol dehydrogenase-like predicted oxidoreductase